MHAATLLLTLLEVLRAWFKNFYFVKTVTEWTQVNKSQLQAEAEEVTHLLSVHHSL